MSNAGYDRGKSLALRERSRTRDVITRRGGPVEWGAGRVKQNQSGASQGGGGVGLSY